MDKIISLPRHLEERVVREASARGMSPAEFVGESLEWVLAQRPWDDPLFADRAVFRDESPDDLAENHDEYLYGDPS